MQTLNVRTIQPVNRPDYNTWCKEFNFGARYARREGIDNAMRIMSLWDGFAKMKEIYISKKMDESDD